MTASCVEECAHGLPTTVRVYAAGTMPSGGRAMKPNACLQSRGRTAPGVRLAKDESEALALAAGTAECLFGPRAATTDH